MAFILLYYANRNTEVTMVSSEQKKSPCVKITSGCSRRNSARRSGLWTKNPGLPSQYLVSANLWELRFLAIRRRGREFSGDRWPDDLLPVPVVSLPAIPKKTLWPGTKSTTQTPFREPSFRDRNHIDGDVFQMLSPSSGEDAYYENRVRQHWAFLDE